MEKYREHKKTAADWNRIFRKFRENRLFMGILLLTAVCAYGYKVTNVTIGIDDTPSLYYFEEGLIAIVGRWVLFLLNKVIFLAEFVPFVACRAATGAFTMVAMIVMVDGLGIRQDFICKIVVSAISLVLNYIFSKWFIFNRDAKQPPEKTAEKTADGSCSED